MIGYIKGNVLSANDGVILLENNGIGYEILCSSAVYQKLLADKKGEVYTFLAVREDGVSLFGFENLEEKNMFLKLISVSGVGPKMGINILSNIKLPDLASSIATSDVKRLSKVKGLGKKTAEKIIVELREKMTEHYISAEQDGAEEIIDITADKNNEDAIIALMSLGFSKTECVAVVKEAKKNGANSIEELIAYSIKHIK